MGTYRPRKIPVELASEVLDRLVAAYGSPRAVAEAYSDRFRVDLKSAERVLRRIRDHRQPTVNRDTVDRICALAGSHLDTELAGTGVLS